MISTPTVLILGAGVSYPYGYPLGAGLVDEINSALNHNPSVELLTDCGFKMEEVVGFRAALYEADSLSIDAFLAHQQPRIVQVGKHAIALVMLNHEHEGKVKEVSGRGNGIYRFLLSKLDAPWFQFASNQLTIITFNYDRSLEQYLFSALRNTYHRGDEWTAEVLSCIPIIHVHGSLGPLPWQDAQGRPYSNNLDVNALKAAAEKILIIPDSHKPTSEFSDVSRLLKEAERIYFLGFGYDSANLDLLDLESLNIYDDQTYEQAKIAQLNLRYFRGSAYKIGTSRRAAIQRARRIWLPDNTSTDIEFLGEYAELD